MPSHALDERADFATTLRATDPEAPTLSGDWTARQLVAHLVQRERSAVELLGRLPSDRLRGIAHRSLDSYAEAHPYDQLVSAFAAGPPWYSPMGIPPVREAVNLLEYLIHHEDVRRAVEPWQPRSLPTDREAAVWARLRMAARWTLRSLSMPVRLDCPGQGAVNVGRGEPRVVVSGPPVELAMVAFGRQRASRADYDGAAADVAAVREGRIAV